MARLRVLIALVGATALSGTGALLAGCGADDVAAEDIAQAAQATTQAGSSRMQIEMLMTVPGGETVRMHGEGIADMVAERGRMTFDLSSLPGGEGEMEMVFSGFSIWMRMPLFEDELPEGIEWIKVDLQEAGKSLGIDFAQFSQMGNDPTKQLDYLRAVAEIENEGEEEVRGVPTTHYSGTTDLREYPKLVPEAEQDAARKNVEAILQLGGDAETPIEVWIDEDDLVRRMRMTVPIPQAGGTEPVETQMEYELYDFGVEVDVEPPSEDDVMDLTDAASDALLQQQQQP